MTLDIYFYFQLIKTLQIILWKPGQIRICLVRGGGGGGGGVRLDLGCRGLGFSLCAPSGAKIGRHHSSQCMDFSALALHISASAQDIKIVNIIDIP